MQFLKINQMIYMFVEGFFQELLSYFRSFNLLVHQL